MSASFMTMAWLGCNAILGNESAVFAPGTPDGLSPDGPGTVDDGAIGRTDGDPRVDAACIDTQSDPRNCGRCGHDCLGGACDRGVCQPLELAQDPGNLEAIAIDATHVYWSNGTSGDIKRVSLADKLVETVYDGPPGMSTGRRFAIHDGRIYFASDHTNAIASCPVTGCANMLTLISTDMEQPNFVDIIGGKLIATSFAGEIRQCSPPCRAGFTAISDNEVRTFYATLAEETYAWSVLGAGGTTKPAIRVKVGAEQPFTIEDVDPVALAFINDEIVFGSFGSGIRAIRRDGGATRLLVRGSTSHVIVDPSGGGVYFTDTKQVGGVYRCPVEGCIDGGMPLATAQAGPAALAVDDKSIVWVNTNDTAPAVPSVRRVAK